MIKIEFVTKRSKTLYNNILKYETEGSSGFDLRACGFDVSFDKFGAIHNVAPTPDDCTPPDITGYTLFSKRRILIKTGIKIQMPINVEMQIRSRNGLALKNGIVVLNSPGTIDSDYNKEIGVILYNSGLEPFTINYGDRIAQGVLALVYKQDFQYVENISDDGRGGFGSTGLK